jgi:hypothetical protein
MAQVDIKYVLLYRTPRAWRITVCEIPDAMACGALPNTPPQAPIEVAQRDLLEHLRVCWGFAGELTWHQTEPDGWAAEPVTHPQS